MDDIGGNSAGMLKGFVDRYDDLLARKEQMTKARKDHYAELRSRNLPAKGIERQLKLAKKDHLKLHEQREEDKAAGVLLGVPVYVGEIVDDGSDPYSDENQEFARQRVSAIKALDEDIEATAEEMKAVLEEASGVGLVKKLIPTVVKIRRNPDAYRENSSILTTYLKAVGVSDDE